MTEDIGRFLYCGDEKEPYGTVVDPNTSTREQLLDAVLGNYVVRLNCEEERYDIVEDTSVDWGDFHFEPPSSDSDVGVAFVALSHSYGSSTNPKGK